MTADLAHHLERCGLRVTQPRLTLLEFFAGSEGHFTPEEISERLRASGHPLSIATLYQNLRVFSARGLIGELIGPGGEARYDTNLDPHSHLVCLRCGQMVDIVLDTAPPVLSGVAQGWQVTRVRTDLQGVCPACQSASA